MVNGVGLGVKLYCVGGYVNCCCFGCIYGGVVFFMVGC